MKATKRLIVSLILPALIAVSVPPGLAMQASRAVEKRISLSSGRTRKIQGRTDSSTSYVYKLRAKKDQHLDARVTAEGGVATFSVVPPGTEILENAAGVKEWSGTLPQTGEYSIIVSITSNSELKSPYTLELTIK